MQQLIKYFGKILILCFWYLNAKSATQHDVQTWFNVTAIGTFHTANKPFANLRYWLEGQERLGDDSSRSTQTLLRPGIGYALTKNLSVWVGYAWVRTGQPLTTRPFIENRIWQQLLWIKTMPYLTFISRTRTEQRFLENNPKTAYRIRQLLKTTIPMKNHPKFSWVSSDELFWHHNNFIGRNSSGLDQNRFFTGLGYKMTDTATMEIGYMNQYIKRFGVPNFLANIASINFYLTL